MTIERTWNGYRTDAERITHGSVHSIPFHFTYVCMYVCTSAYLPACVIDKYVSSRAKATEPKEQEQKSM